MLRKGIVVVALLMLPAFSYGYFEEGDKEVLLSGSAFNDGDFEGVAIAVNGSVGYFITDNLEGSIRQSLVYDDIANDASVNGSTRVALDFHFDLEAWQPFVGGNFGYVYGDAVNDTFELAPEAGVKWFVNSTTFIMAMVEYQFFFDSGDEVDNGFNDGQFIWSLGIGFRF
jgi:hypothetical protein